MRGKTRPIRIRWTLNYQNRGLSRDVIRGFSPVLAQDVAVQASEEMWKTVKSRIEQRLTVDVFREISRMAQLYKQLIIGLSGENGGRDATLTSAAQAAPGMRSFTRWRMSVDWTRRKRSYLRRKLKRPPKGVGHNRWFEHTGLLGRTMGRGRTWTDAFGPVQVSVTRTSLARSQSRMTQWLNTGFRNSPTDTIRAHIAQIRVNALGDITPAMLPALATGDIDDMAPDGRKTGLIGQFPRTIAHHLAGSQRFVPYRHTIEPFLGFVLTRAIPNAVAKRLNEGLGADIQALRRSRDDRFEGQMW